MVKYKIRERVIYKEQYNNPGHMNPGQKIDGIIINISDSDQHPATYRIELNMVWGGRVPNATGKKIVVGNVFERYLSPATEQPDTLSG